MIGSLAGTGAPSPYAARYGGGQVAVFGLSGDIIRKVPVPVTTVTNVRSGGNNRRTLVITGFETASHYEMGVDVSGSVLFERTKSVRIIGSSEK